MPSISTARPRTSTATAASEALALPADLDYRQPVGPLQRAAAKSRRASAASLGQAGRIEGVTPAALALLAAQRAAARANASMRDRPHRSRPSAPDGSLPARAQKGSR